MALPDPKPGLVIRYDYLWSHEAATGRDYGKERPACLVAASDPAASPRFVVILPITHTPPGMAERRLGAVAGPAWKVQLG